MINAANELASYEGDNWEDHISPCLYDIFKDLIEAYKDHPIPDLARCIIRYIVWAYTADSKRVAIGADWLTTKKKIYEEANLPPLSNIQDDVLFHRNEPVLLAIKRWIEFQDNDAYREIAMLKDLRLEMQISANSIIRNAQLEINYDQKFKNAKYSIELYNMINDAESKLIQKNEKLKEAYGDVKRAAQSKGYTMGPETWSK
jgi:hypothetical protein